MNEQQWSHLALYLNGSFDNCITICLPIHTCRVSNASLRVMGRHNVKAIDIHGTVFFIVSPDTITYFLDAIIYEACKTN